jgi:6-phosphofructokinase 2
MFHSEIITITFSPCIDKNTSVPSLMPEKKLRCTNPVLTPGGGGINVARAIRKLGGDAKAIYPAGGYTGKLFTRLMKEEEIASIVIETEQETRENIIVLEESTNQQYRFGMPGTQLKEMEWEQLLQQTEAIDTIDYLVVSGSLPPGTPKNIFTRIAALAKKKKAQLIVDTSGEALKSALQAGVYLIKPSLDELSELVNKVPLATHEIVPAARQIIQNGQCEVVITSMGAKGAVLVTKDIVQVIAPPPACRKSTVGAGDSMVAGIVLSLAKGETLEEAAQYGIACGTAATMNPGTELCRLEDVERLYTRINRLQY